MFTVAKTFRTMYPLMGLMNGGLSDMLFLYKRAIEMIYVFAVLVIATPKIDSCDGVANTMRFKAPNTIQTSDKHRCACHFKYSVTYKSRPH